jgi:hypothetical protein
MMIAEMNTPSVQQARRNAQFLELIEECAATPDPQRLKASYSDKLIRLRALTTEELYGVIVQTYNL